MYLVPNDKISHFILDYVIFYCMYATYLLHGDAIFFINKIPP
jgi:hypothetical protein